MKKYLLFLVFLMACAEKEENTEQAISTELDIPEQEHWVVYEGVVRSDAGNDVKLELSLLQGVVGVESTYKTEEEYIGADDERLLTMSTGKYTLLFGSNDEMLISIPKNSGMTLGWMPQGGYGMNPTPPSAAALGAATISKLAFKAARNSNELVMVGDDSAPVAEDNRYTLKKRSILFTAEGFVTIEPHTTDFFEINTRQNWTMALAGAYGELEAKYFKLATEKHEGIYLKAIAYYIDDTDSTGVEIKKLVVKRIVEMKSNTEFVRSQKISQ